MIRVYFKEIFQHIVLVDYAGKRLIEGELTARHLYTFLNS